MRAFRFSELRWDKKYIIAYIITIFLAIICGIVLFNITIMSIYLQNYASEYIYYVYNFKNGTLILQRLLYGVVYGYAFFAIAFFTRRRYFAVPVLFLKAGLCTIYACVLVSIGGFAGVLTVIFMFIPSSLISLFSNIFLLENCTSFGRGVAPFLPLILTAADMIIFLLLLNVVFRVVIFIS